MTWELFTTPDVRLLAAEVKLKCVCSSKPCETVVHLSKLCRCWTCDVRIVCFAHGTLGEAQRCGRLTGWGRHIYDPTENYILKTLTRMRFSWACAVVIVWSNKQTKNINPLRPFLPRTLILCFYVNDGFVFRSSSVLMLFASLTHVPSITK